jgi:hypothetical protein
LRYFFRVADGAFFAAILHRTNLLDVTHMMKKIKAGRYCLRRHAQTFRKVELRERVSFRQQGQ